MCFGRSLADENEDQYVRSPSSTEEDISQEIVEENLEICSEEEWKCNLLCCVSTGPEEDNVHNDADNEEQDVGDYEDWEFAEDWEAALDEEEVEYEEDEEDEEDSPPLGNDLAERYLTDVLLKIKHNKDCRILPVIPEEEEI